MSQMEIVWLAAVIVFGILESVTFQFISIWFAGGALIALISSLMGAGISAQWIIFAVSTAILLILTRPFVKKLAKTEKTNADSLIGKTVVMTKECDKRGEGGEAKAFGSVWTVHSSNGEPIEKDEVVTVEKIEGVKLIVKK